MCLILPGILIDARVERLTIDLLWHDMREYNEFKPFVKFFIESEYNKRMIDYCNRAKRKYDDYLTKSLTIRLIEMERIGVDVVLPFCINRWDIMEKSEQYLLWKKCYNDYINNKFKS